MEAYSRREGIPRVYMGGIQQGEVYPGWEGVHTAGGGIPRVVGVYTRVYSLPTMLGVYTRVYSPTMPPWVYHGVHATDHRYHGQHAATRGAGRRCPGLKAGE